jgi:ABC-2 type transport system ATP-binding protein
MSGNGPVIELEDARKEYRRTWGGRVTALRGLDLSVPEGGVFGFLGPNGSGKTTSIRCLLGLARLTSGRARLFGLDSPAHLPSVIGRIGSIVEAPMLFPTFSARRNLLLLAGMAGRPRIGAARVDAVLDQVGLADRAGDLVKGYSLGMRQRLGLAAALLKDPELIVLDEPANGLDPAGIREVRLLLRQLAAEGRTVFVSSHQLSEVEQTCDQVAIVHHGRTLVTGRVADIIGPSRLVARIDDPAAAASVLARAGLSAVCDNGTLRIGAAPEQGACVARLLGQAGHWVQELRPERNTLEDLFLELTTEDAA